MHGILLSLLGLCAQLYLELLRIIQMRICRTVGLSVAASLEPFAHRRTVASSSLFYRYYLGICSFELAQLVPLRYSRGKSARYFDGLYDFCHHSQIIQGCLRQQFCLAQLDSSLQNAFFGSMSCFKPRINRHLLNVGCFPTDFMYTFHGIIIRRQRIRNKILTSFTLKRQLLPVRLASQ